jgi:hypothetical protein
MTSEGLGEMFEGDSADTGAGKFPLVSMGSRKFLIIFIPVYIIIVINKDNCPPK